MRSKWEAMQAVFTSVNDTGPQGGVDISQNGLRRWGQNSLREGSGGGQEDALTQDDPSFICPASGNIADLVAPTPQHQHG